MGRGDGDGLGGIVSHHLTPAIGVGKHDWRMQTDKGAASVRAFPPSVLRTFETECYGSFVQIAYRPADFGLGGRDAASILVRKDREPVRAERTSSYAGRTHRVVSRKVATFHGSRAEPWSPSQGSALSTSQRT